MAVFKIYILVKNLHLILFVWTELTLIFRISRSVSIFAIFSDKLLSLESHLVENLLRKSTEVDKKWLRKAKRRFRSKCCGSDAGAFSILTVLINRSICFGSMFVDTIMMVFGAAKLDPINDSVENNWNKFSFPFQGGCRYSIPNHRRTQHQRKRRSENRQHPTSSSSLFLSSL